MRTGGAIGLIILTIALIVGAVYLDYRAELDCNARHGNWTVVGYGTSISKRSISVYPIYGCVGAR